MQGIANAPGDGGGESAEHARRIPRDDVEHGLRNPSAMRRLPSESPPSRSGARGLLRLVEEAAFSIAITACAANVSSNSIWRALKGPGSRRVTPSVPIASPSRSNGTTMKLRNPSRGSHRAVAAPIRGLGIVDVDRRLGADRDGVRTLRIG